MKKIMGAVLCAAVIVSLGVVFYSPGGVKVAGNMADKQDHPRGTEERYVAAEVKYLAEGGRPVRIESVISPVIYAPDHSVMALSGGGFNMESYDTRARISQTGTMEYAAAASRGIAAGKNADSVRGEANGRVTIVSKAGTFAVNIDLSDLY